MGNIERTDEINRLYHELARMRESATKWRELHGQITEERNACRDQLRGAVEAERARIVDVIRGVAEKYPPGSETRAVLVNLASAAADGGQ